MLSTIIILLVPILNIHVPIHFYIKLNRNRYSTITIDIVGKKKNKIGRLGCWSGIWTQNFHLSSGYIVIFLSLTIIYHRVSAFGCINKWIGETLTVYTYWSLYIFGLNISYRSRCVLCVLYNCVRILTNSICIQVAILSRLLCQRLLWKNI